MDTSKASSDRRETHVFFKTMGFSFVLGLKKRGKEECLPLVCPPFQVEGNLLHVLYGCGHERLLCRISQPP